MRRWLFKSPAWLSGLAMPLACLLCAPALAASFSVSPIRVELTAARPTATLTLRNGSTEATVVQVEVVAWLQQDGQDVYAQTRDLIATPPVFTVPAGEMQVVRIGLRQSVEDKQSELSYRVYLQEVPGAPKNGQTGLQIALRVGVPVFVQPPVATRPELHWRIERTAQGMLRVTANNEGNAHIQITDFVIAPPGSANEIATQQVAAYLLSGQSKTWLLKPKSLPSGGQLRLTAYTDAGESNANLALEKTP